ncbi:unnamed protein product, partial [marine sediment metagenome]
AIPGDLYLGIRITGDEKFIRRGNGKTSNV